MASELSESMIRDAFKLFDTEEPLGSTLPASGDGGRILRFTLEEASSVFTAAQAAHRRRLAQAAQALALPVAPTFPA